MESAYCDGVSAEREVQQECGSGGFRLLFGEHVSVAQRYLPLFPPEVAADESATASASHQFRILPR